jgi:hypothetical protein
MIKNYIKILKKLLIIIIFYSFSGYAQPVLPQRAITLRATQELNFGKFYDEGSGGSITVDWQGVRSSTGGIYGTISSLVSPALFEVKLCQGRVITISYPQTTTLTGMRTGGSIILNIGPTEKGGNGAIFATDQNCDFITILRVGGTLIIPPNTPVDDYQGSFEISFDQQ